MDIISLFGISVGLAMDAFAVSISNGAAYHRASLKKSAVLAGYFGFFQAIMPTIGWLAGKAFASFITNVDHWIAFLLLGYLGGKMIWETLKGETEAPSEQADQSCGFASHKTMFILAIATSIDALATGLILPSAVGAESFPLMLTAVLTIGLITFIISMIGVLIGKKFGTAFSSKAEIFGGIVLIGIGVKILLEHLFFA